MNRHIAIYTDDPDKGGVACYNHELAMGLVARGHRVTMMQAQSTSEPTREQARAGITHEWIGYDTGKEFVRTITDTGTATGMLKTCVPDLVIFSDCCAISNIAGKHATITAGIPFLTIVHNAAPYLAKRFAECLPVMSRQFARANQVITVSSENVRLLRSLFCLPEDKGVVVFPCAAGRYFKEPVTDGRAELRRKLGIPVDAIVSLTSARLDPLKGFIFQFFAMENLRAQFPGSKLLCVWAGDGDAFSALSEEIEKKKLNNCIKLVGRQSDIAEWLDAADMFTLTSLTEGMPISIMEAMARSRPIVSTAIGGVAEEIGNAGVLLPDANTLPRETVMALIKAWVNLERDPALRKKLGAAGRERALKYFRAEGMVSRILAEVELALRPASVAESVRDGLASLRITQ